MLKVILLELLKSYLLQRKNPYATYARCAMIVSIVSALIFFAVTDILYFQGKLHYVGSLLMWGTASLSLAILIKAVDFFLGHHYQRQELSNLAFEVLPVVLRLLPVGVTSYIVWTLIKGGVAKKWRRLTH